MKQRNQRTKKSKSRLRRTTKFIGKKVAKSTLHGAKSAFDKANPLDQNPDLNSTDETGIESLRLGYTSTKKTVRGVKIIYKAPITAVKTTIKIVQITKNIIINTVALLTNPIFWIVVAVLLVCCVIVSSVFLILGGGASSTNSNEIAYGTAAGVKEFETAYPEAEEFYRIACEKKQTSFNELIDELYYSLDDLSHSDLVYMEKNPQTTVYDKSLATEYRKYQLKEAWNVPYSAAEAVALIYVYLEKKKNDEGDTEGQIYEVEFSQEIFDEMLDIAVQWADNTYPGQECIQKNCSIHIEYVPNPKYEEVDGKAEFAFKAYTEWQEIVLHLEYCHEKIKDGKAQQEYYENNIEWRISNWKIVYEDFVPIYAYESNNGRDFEEDLRNLYNGFVGELDNIPPEIEIKTETCDRNHNLHSIGLNFMSMDEIMTELDFSDIYKQWYEITYDGFMKNPNVNETEE